MLLKNSIHTNKQTSQSSTHALCAVGLTSFFLCVITQLGAQLCYGWLLINTHPTLLCSLGHSPLCDQGIRDPFHSGSSGFITCKSFAIRLVSFAHVTSFFCLLDNGNFLHAFTAYYDTVMLRWVSVRFRAIQRFVLSRLLLQTNTGVTRIRLIFCVELVQSVET